MQVGIVDEPVGRRATAAYRLILAVIQRRGEGDGDDADPLALADKLRLFVGQRIEEREADGLDQRGLACAVAATDGGGARAEIDMQPLVTLDVFEFDAVDSHGFALSIRSIRSPGRCAMGRYVQHRTFRTAREKRKSDLSVGYYPTRAAKPECTFASGKV